MVISETIPTADMIPAVAAIEREGSKPLLANAANNSEHISKPIGGANATAIHLNSGVLKGRI